MLVSEPNNDHNIKRLFTKMSEECSSQIKLSENLTDCVTSSGITFFNNLQNCVVDDIKSDDLSLSYDHLYASHTENVDRSLAVTEPASHNAESEVMFLKDWLNAHLELVQQQHEEIAWKDRTILFLRQENEMLKEQLHNLNQDEHATLQLNNFDSLTSNQNSFNQAVDEITNDASQIEEDNKQDLLLLDLPNNSAVFNSSETFKYDVPPSELPPSSTYFNNVLNETANINDISPKPCDNTDVGITLNSCPSTIVQEIATTITEPEVVTNSAEIECETVVNERDNFVVNTPVEDTLNNLRMSIRRKRLCSSSNSNNESGHDEFSSPSTKKTRRKERKVSVNDEKILLHEEQYFTQSGDHLLPSPLDSDPTLESCSANLEVPRWRVKVYTSCYAMEGTENLDDEVYNKRHSRLEIDERRRKKWDIQRIREQRNIEKLKQRQERIGTSGKKDQTKPVCSFWPTIEDAKYLEITTQLPVTAFGAPIPRFPSSEFNLPWLTNPSTLIIKKPHRKSTTRRKATKR